MSYCRWSSMNFTCDLYCYESNEGFVTDVAAHRYKGPIPEVPFILYVTPEVWTEAKKVQSEWLDTCGTEPIDLPHAGETFLDVELLDFASRLAYLKELGYVFPEGLIDSILKEAEEEEDGE